MNRYESFRLSENMAILAVIELNIVSRLFLGIVRFSGSRGIGPMIALTSCSYQRLPPDTLVKI
jgi:hypothetical protein